MKAALLDAPTAPADEKPRPVFRLKLDHEDVYFGSEPFEGIAGACDVVLDHAPDNVPGRYHWSREHSRLEPLPKEKQKEELGGPTLEQAFYDLTKMVMDPEGLMTPTRRLAAWCAWFEKTIDEKG
jgi:hypothetical protein